MPLGSATSHSKRRGPHPWGLYYAFLVLTLAALLVGFWLGTAWAYQPDEIQTDPRQTPVAVTWW